LVETDSAEPDQPSADVTTFVGISAASPEVVDIQLQQQQQQQVKRFVADDGREFVSLTAVEYDEIVKRRQVADWLYDQLNDERRQRLQVAEKCRSCSEALAREHHLVMRYRQMLIKNRLQLEPSLDLAKDVTADLPEAFLEADRTCRDAEFELRGRCFSGINTESGPTTEEVAVCGTPSVSGVRQSVLESDEAVVVSPPFQVDAGPTSSHEHSKNSGKVSTTADDDQDVPLHHRQLVDEAMKAVNMATASTTSRDLLQKVLEQNARLKQLLKKIVDTEGMTIRKFLVSC